MPHDFYPRLTEKIRMLEHLHRHAERLARFRLPPVILIGVVPATAEGRGRLV
jgi:hypothetical protein